MFWVMSVLAYSHRFFYIHAWGAFGWLLFVNIHSKLGALLDAKGQSPSYGQLFVNVKEATGLELNKDKGIVSTFIESKTLW